MCFPMNVLSILVLFFFVSHHSLHAQNETINSVSDSNRIEIIHISTFKESSNQSGLTRELIGDVHVRQKDMNLWCEKAFLLPQKQIRASDSVQILQGDTIRIFSDSLFYDGFSRKAELNSNVVLKDSIMQLFTDQLFYDLNSKIALFPNPTIVQRDSVYMIAQSGNYSAKTGLAHFQDSVKILHNDYRMNADVLDFDLINNIAYFDGPTKVYNNEKLLYCEDGYFDIDSSYAELYQNAIYKDFSNDQPVIAKADTILYSANKEMYYLIGNAFYENGDYLVHADTIVVDEKNSKYDFFGHPVFESKNSTSNQKIISERSNFDAANDALYFSGKVSLNDEKIAVNSDSMYYQIDSRNAFLFGSVIFKDSLSDLSIYSEKAIFNDSTEYMMAYDRPYLETILNKDTLWLKSDTITVNKDSVNGEKIMRAYHNVHIFKSDLQVKCDSMNFKDSIFNFYENPILWINESQFTANFIDVHLKNEAIHQLYLYEESLIVSTEDEFYFDQISGKNLRADLINNQVKTIFIDDQGEVVYYVKDESGAYMNVNDIDCKKMMMYFDSNTVNKINFMVEPSAVLYPMRQINHKTLQLKGFKWLKELRFKNLEAFMASIATKTEEEKIPSPE